MPKIMFKFYANAERSDAKIRYRLICIFGVVNWYKTIFNIVQYSTYNHTPKFVFYQLSEVFTTSSFELQLSSKTCRVPKNKPLNWVLGVTTLAIKYAYPLTTTALNTIGDHVYNQWASPSPPKCYQIWLAFLSAIHPKNQIIRENVTEGKNEAAKRLIINGKEQLKCSFVLVFLLKEKIRMQKCLSPEKCTRIYIYTSGGMTIAYENINI